MRLGEQGPGLKSGPELFLKNGKCFVSKTACHLSVYVLSFLLPPLRFFLLHTVFIRVAFYVFVYSCNS